MKKVMMISYNYPPLAGMGMFRSLKFAKFLPLFGWEPIVLTIAVPKIKATQRTQYWLCNEDEGHLPGVKIIRTKIISLKSSWKYLNKLYSFKKNREDNSNASNASNAHSDSVPSFRDSKGTEKIKNGLRTFWNTWIEFPDNTIGWYPYALRDALTYLHKNHVDVIFSTALPITSHLIASRLSKKTGIPWIADFRDLWSKAEFRGANKFRMMIDSWFEVWAVKNASSLITVSEPHMEDLLNLHKTFSSKNCVIYNGYDAEDYLEPNTHSNRVFTITYTGRMYDIDFSSKGRTPSILFESIAALIREKRIPKDRIRCLIYGEHPQELIKMIRTNNLTKIVKCLGTVPFREAIKAQQQADVLLHLNWNDLDQKGVLSGKIFEYLGAKKNILSIPFYNEGVFEILKTTKSGVMINSVDACKEQIWKWFQEFDANGAIQYKGVPDVLENYSRKKGTEKLADILDKVSQGKG